MIGINKTYAQRGLIITPSTTNVLDPNGDGYVSKTSAGFSNDGYYVDEFEFNMFGLPIFENGEVLNDIQSGAACGTTDLSVDTTGYSVYAVKTDDGNLIFRFRLAGDRPSVEAYSILIDTDGLFGAEDPNATPDNPGFELDISLIKGTTQGIYVYNIDGIESCPSADLHYNLSTNYQKSIADIESCGDADYFLDFYVPFSDLEAAYGITTSTEIRMIAVTNVSATCAYGGSISDIGGVDDTQFGGCLPCAFDSLASVQCATAFDDLCDTCGGFKFGVTPKPSIRTPIKAEQQIVVGTAAPTSMIYVDVYNSSSQLVDQDTTMADDYGNWVAFMDSSLFYADSITARAELLGKCRSGLSESDLAYAIVVYNHPTVLSGASDTLIYNENDGNVPVQPSLTISDPDDSLLVKAATVIIDNFNPTEDKLVFSNQNGITGNFDAVTGVMSLNGIATLMNYQNALASLSYNNNSEDPVPDLRRIMFTVKDTIDWSDSLYRYVKVEPVNDPPVLTGSSNSLGYNNGDGTVVIDNSIAISDPDNLSITGGRVRIGKNYISSEDNISFTDQLGITGSYDPATAEIVLTGTASLSDYATALSSVTYTNSNITPNLLTRQIWFRVSDGTDSSNIFIRDIDITSSNSPPEIVDTLNNSLDTVYVSTTEDMPVEICLNAIDPEGDYVSISDAISLSGNGTVTFDSLCLDFTPDPDYYGSDTLKVQVCDDATPSLCDSAVIIIDITPVDDKPEITSGGVPIDTINITTTEDTPVSYCITVSDVENDPVVISSLSSSGGLGNYNIDASDSLCFEFVPDPDISGTEIDELIVCENFPGGLCDTVVVNLKITPVNDAPQIVDSTNTPVDTIRAIAYENTTELICVQATDIENDPVRLTATGTITGHGSYNIGYAADLCFNFTPALDFTGEEIGIIEVCDLGSPVMCDSAIVVIEVLPVNKPPDIQDNGTSVDTINVSTPEDTPVDICLDVVDPDGDTVHISSTTLIPGNGSVSVDSLCITYTPDPGYSGTDTINVFVCDSSLCDSVLIIIDVTPVNHPPEIIGSGGGSVDTLFVNTPEDTPVEVCLDVVDPDGDTVHIGSTTLIPGNGSVSVDSLCITYTPDPGYSGTDTIDVFVCDSSLCDSVLIIVDVTPVNHPPDVIESGGGSIDTLFVNTPEDTPLDTCLDVIDPDGDIVNITSSDLISGTGTVSISGICLTYDPAPDYNGTDTLNIMVCDNGTPSLCDSVIVIIDVLPVDDPPRILFNGNHVDTIFLTTPEDVPIDYCLEVTDKENDSLGISSINSIANLGTYTINNGNNLCFTFDPGVNLNGTETAQLIVCETQSDGLCDSVTLITDITPVNDPPQIVNDQNQPVDTVRFQITENTSQAFCVKVSDPENDPVTLTEAMSRTQHGIYDLGSTGDLCFNFTPDNYFSGNETGFVKVCDTGSPVLCDSAVAVIEVQHVNHAPEILFNGEPADTIFLSTDEDTDLDFCLPITDVDSDLVTISDITGIDPNGTFDQLQTGDYCFRYSPPPDYFGKAIWKIKVCDNGFPSLCDSDVIVILVNPVNDPPVAVNDTVSVLRNHTVTGNVLDNDSDPESDQLSIKNTATEGPLHGDLTLETNGKFTYKPYEAFHGSDSFIYNACDNGTPSLCSPASVFIEVEDIPLSIYQAVSPNGDGLNDYFRIDGIEFFKNNVVQIFNRYNLLVFETQHYNNETNNWHGQANKGFSKKDLPEDTYYYIINLGDGSPLLSGFLMLKRQ